MRLILSRFKEICQQAPTGHQLFLPTRKQNIKTYLMQTLIMFSILSCQLLKVPEMLLFSEMMC